eukprot:Hpha_TRINITY_DN14112_c0_g1::TRINITY_DN14112_c0_g1_i1::g.11130::m.11130/K02942/RP-LP1, RPLP1; large subunit ribosomal protein LP1
MSTDELACTYAALILHEEGSEVTPEKITEVCAAAGVKPEPFYPTLFASFLAKRPLGDLLSSVGGGGGGEAVAAAADAGGAGGDKKEEAKAPAPQEASEEEDTDFGLFD